MNSTVITIKGIVQGVGFRPFVWRLAKSLSLAGTVQNTSEGVQILLEGNEQAISKFLFQLSNNPPPLSKITSIKQNSAPVQNTQDFIILKSISTDELSSQVSPDISLCADCRKELYDPKDRRYHYPFINCTNCGPRYSIIKKLPYDRAATSMSEFNLCDSCAAEYSNPADRRYHAQPVACPDCGPHVFAVSPNGDKIEEPWENVWSDVVTSGKIAAVKGVGGFHLACNALDEIATALLRKRKRRESKPFAVMTRNIDWIKSVCHVSRDETALMKSRVCPIVILRIKKHLPSFKHIAPGLDTIGVMLPYSPLHELMCSDVNLIVVMTSANYSNEPMISRNSDALEKLHNLADIFLMHNRDIVNRCEDTVCICPEKQAIIIRPGRGHAPFSLNIDSNKQILSFGADLKNTFAVSHHGRITLSQYIGDLEHPKTQDILRSSVKKVLSFYNLKPESIIHDLHPDYFSTQIALDFAQKNNVPAVAVQHHHAHLAAG